MDEQRAHKRYLHLSPTTHYKMPSNYRPSPMSTQAVRPTDRLSLPKARSENKRARSPAAGVRRWLLVEGPWLVAHLRNLAICPGPSNIVYTGLLFVAWPAPWPWPIYCVVFVSRPCGFLSAHQNTPVGAPLVEFILHLRAAPNSHTPYVLAFAFQICPCTETNTLRLVHYVPLYRLIATKLRAR